MEKVLNQQEIDDMVRRVRSGDLPPAPTGAVITAWDIRQAGQIGSEQLRAINQLHETFARNLTIAVSGHLRVVFDCSLASAEHLTYREFLQRVPENNYLASCELSPVEATSVLQLDLSICYPIIDVMLGGEGKNAEITRDVTEIEEQVLEGIVRIICRELQTSWQAIALEFNFGARQKILQTQCLMPPDEKNLCLSFEIKMSDSRGTLNLAIPAVVSNALLRKISADFSYQRPRGLLERRRQIQQKLMNCYFPVELAMPNLQVPLHDLSGLRSGGLITFSHSVSHAAELLVDGVRLCSAEPVRVHAHRAARVLSLEKQLPNTGEL
jgi:flagellar motor switch protein FliM